MKKIFNRKYILLLVFFLAFSWQNAWAQCAMCRATVQNQASDGGDLVAGLNAGILYLAAMPYVIFAIIGYVFYTNTRKKNVRKNQVTSHRWG